MAVGLSDERLSAIRERVEKATPGPWAWGDREAGADTWGHRGPDLQTTHGEVKSCPYFCRWRDTDGVEHRGAGPDEPHEHFYPTKIVLSSWGYDADGLNIEAPDAEFVAHARTDVPDLLSEIDALRAELQVARAERHQMMDAIGWLLESWPEDEDPGPGIRTHYWRWTALLGADGGG